MRMKKIGFYGLPFALLLCLLPVGSLRGQASANLMDRIFPKEFSYLRQGNKAFDKSRYAESEVYYKKALEANPASAAGSFNLGDALFQQKRYEKATSAFSEAAATAATPELKAQAMHNLGNSYFEAGKYRESIAAFKAALRVNPADEDTRYNLAVAQKKLEQQQQQQQQQQSGSGAKQEPGDQQNNNSQNKPDESSPPQNSDKKNPQMNKDEIDRMLDALRRQEENVAERMQRRSKGQQAATEKDW